MKRKLWLAIVAAVAAAAFGTACADKKVEDYLGPGGQMEAWGKKIQDAICQLEDANESSIDNAKRICPKPPGDKVTVPTYPPK